MFWSDPDPNIDSLLQKEDVTLTEILEENNVLQECMSPNKSLIDFLCKDDNLTEMISALINEPSNNKDELERFKYANTICEILTFEKNPFADLIVNSELYMSKLWSFVCIAPNQNEVDENSSCAHSNSILNPLLASFFMKVFHYLFTHQTEKVLDFIDSQKEPNDLVSVVLRHINTSAIMDLIFKSWEYINCCDTKIEPEIFDRYKNILSKNSFIEKLIEVYKDKDSDSKHQYAANLISDLIKSKRDLLSSTKQVDEILLQFENVELSKSLLTNIFETRTKSSISSGLKIIQALLVYQNQAQKFMDQNNEEFHTLPNGKSDDSEISMEKMPGIVTTNSQELSNEEQFMPPQLSSPVDIREEHLSRCIRNVCSVLNERIEDFVCLLVDPPDIKPIATTVGILNRPLGLIRLEVVHLFVALFATSDYSILEKCSQLNVLKLLTELFFEYSLNNQLHKYFEQIIDYLFQNYSKCKKCFEDEIFETIENSHNENDASKLNNIQVDGVVTPEETESQTVDSISQSSNQKNILENNEKMRYLNNLHNITKVLVKQVLVDCRLIEKILECYLHEKVPVKRESKQSNNVDQEFTDNLDNKVENIEIKSEQEVDNKSLEIDQSQSDATKKTTLKNCRPSYMGHLRLIANILRDHCSDELLSEFQVDSNVVQQWKDFNNVKLTQLNELVNSKLVDEGENDQEKFKKYQLESISLDLPSNIDFIPSDLGPNSSNDFNQAKLMNKPDLSFDKFWKPKREKYNFIKYFDEKCSSIFDEYEDDEYGNIGELAVKEFRLDSKQQELIVDTFKNKFFALSESRDVPESNAPEVNFANFDNLEFNPWAEDFNGSLTTSTVKGQAIGESDTWTADFENDPFKSDIADTTFNSEQPNNIDSEVFSEPKTSSPIKNEEQSDENN